MNFGIKLLDCTLRDGAYIVDGKFGEPAIKGIISKLETAGIDIIECGWLKNAEHKPGTTYFHTPEDVLPYLVNKSKNAVYVAMIDWDRYDPEVLPPYDGSSIDAIRIVFPYGRHKEGMAIGAKIKEKGYRVFLQAANTLAYGEQDLQELAEGINQLHPEGISVVDTFGAMYEEDLCRILQILDAHVDKDISIGFHSHNNQQLAFANSIYFVKWLEKAGRSVIVDSSLSGMGRGAGNATTELMVNYLNSKYHHNYDLDAIMDAIDVYMTGFQERFTWGYSTPYFIAGMYCCHVNNIAYLQNNHRTSAHDMRNVIASLSPEERKKYDYDLLEQKYIENQDRKIDDKEAVGALRKQFGITGNHPRKVLLIAPGKSSLLHQREIREFVAKEDVIVIAVNALLPEYEYDYLFVTNPGRYEYAKTAYREQFDKTKKILLSNVKNVAGDKEYVVNYNRAIKRGFIHFDNAVICALRLMDRLHVERVFLAGFDGFRNSYNESYADESLPTLNPGGRWSELNAEIQEMFHDVKLTTSLDITFLTESLFDC